MRSNHTPCCKLKVIAPQLTLDWHNDMSKLVLDINERIAAAADDRARGIIVRRLRRALEVPG
jgi:metallo-beta-lactamase family protein